MPSTALQIVYRRQEEPHEPALAHKFSTRPVNDKCLVCEQEISPGNTDQQLTWETGECRRKHRKCTKPAEAKSWEEQKEQKAQMISDNGRTECAYCHQVFNTEQIKAHLFYCPMHPVFKVKTKALNILANVISLWEARHYKQAIQLLRQGKKELEAINSTDQLSGNGGAA